ncbi:MAG TPA: glycosyltransferase family 4 protein [Thermoleophilia bacterium]|nr:glycosyltransferase family 4 protein [Thermoleophilia bacterium]
MHERSDKGGVPRSLWVTNDFPPRVGGAQTYYWQIIQTLDPADVVIVAPAHRDAAAFDASHPYTVVRTPFTTVWPLPAAERLCEQLVREHRLEVLQLGHPLPAGLLGPWLRRTARLPYVIFLGGAEITVPGAVPGLARVLGWVLAESSALFTVSEYTAAQAVRLSGGVARAEVLRPALDVDSYPLTTAESAVAARARLGVDEGPLVVCVGRLVPRKGQDMLIEALDGPGLDGVGSDVRLALVGGGRLARELRERATAAGLGDRVYLPGEVSDAELRLWLQAADVFAGPSRTRHGGLEVEGYGIVYAEAALTGLPVIAGRSGGAPEAVDDGATGYVVDAHGPAELRAALCRLLVMSPGERRAMGERGRELALSRHSPAVAAERYHDLLAAVVQRARRNPSTGGTAQ